MSYLPHLALSPTTSTSDMFATQSITSDRILRRPLLHAHSCFTFGDPPLLIHFTQNTLPTSDGIQPKQLKSLTSRMKCKAPKIPVKG
jgi:hypothetical protein